MNLRDAVQYASDLAKAKRKPQVIARDVPGAYQVRIAWATSARGRKITWSRVVEGRRFIDEGNDRGWARWSTFLGFSVDSVLADDWRVLEDHEVSP